MRVSVYEAKTKLSRLLDLVEQGEDVIIQRHGKPVARLVPARKKQKSPLGMMRGEFQMAPGWGKPLTDEESEAFWEGRW